MRVWSASIAHNTNPSSRRCASTKLSARSTAGHSSSAIVSMTRCTASGAGPGGKVRTNVGVELVLLDRAVGGVVVVPAAGRRLRRDEPAIGSHRLIVEAGDVKCHRTLDEVPRIAVSAGEPRDHSVGLLQGGEMAAPIASSSVAVSTPGKSNLTSRSRRERGSCREQGEQAVGNSGQPGLMDDVPLEELAVPADERMVVVVHADCALQPPVRRVQGVGVMAADHLEGGRSQLGLRAPSPSRSARDRRPPQGVVLVGSIQLIFSGSHEGTVVASSPPRRTTRRSSARAPTSSVMCSSTSEVTTASKHSSGNGRAVASPRRVATTCLSSTSPVSAIAANVAARRLRLIGGTVDRHDAITAAGELEGVPARTRRRRRARGRRTAHRTR